MPSIKNRFFMILIAALFMGCTPEEASRDNELTSDYWEKAAVNREQAARAYEEAGEVFVVDAQKQRGEGEQYENSSDFIDQETYSPEIEKSRQAKAELFRKAIRLESSAGNNYINAGKNWDKAADNWRMAAESDPAKKKRALEQADFARHRATQAFLKVAESYTRVAGDSSADRGDAMGQRLRSHEIAAENYEAVAGRGYAPETE